MASFTKATWDMLEELFGCPDLTTCYLYGIPGLGKTYAAYHFGRIHKGVYAVTLTEDTSAAELAGHFIFKGGDTVWHDGPFTRAMRDGARLVINEITNASGDVQQLLYPVLEGFETARTTLLSGETIRPAPGFHVIATDNRSPEQLPDALQDRFMSHIEVTEMHPMALSSLNEAMRDVARQTIGDGDRFISARGWKHMEVLSHHFDLHDAAKMVFGMDRGRMIADAVKLALKKRAAQEAERETAAQIRIMREVGE